jgi:hypothetical protein
MTHNIYVLLKIKGLPHVLTYKKKKKEDSPPFSKKKNYLERHKTTQAMD